MRKPGIPPGQKAALGVTIPSIGARPISEPAFDNYTLRKCPESLGLCATAYWTDAIGQIKFKFKL